MSSAAGPGGGGDPLARWSQRMNKQRQKDEEEAAKRQVHYKTLPTRTTHLQVHCFDNKGTFTSDELLAEDATIRKSTAGATRRRMILHDRLTRKIDGWRFELNEERAKPTQRAKPGSTAMEEVVQPRGYTSRGEVVANSGGHHLRNQRTRHLNDQPRGRPPNKLGVVVDVDFTVRPVLSPSPGDGTRQESAPGSPGMPPGDGDEQRGSVTPVAIKKTTSMEERRRAAARAARRPASASAFTPSPNKEKNLSIVGVKATGRPLSSHPAARGIETALNRTTQSINSTTGPLPRKLRETPMRPGAIETKRVATRKQATAKPDMVFGPPRYDKMGRGDTHEERTHLAGTHAMAHSRIMRETARRYPSARPSSAPIGLNRKPSTKPPTKVDAAERVARTYGPKGTTSAVDTRKTSILAATARKQAFGYSFANDADVNAGDRTASKPTPFAPRTATLGEKMLSARMDATATRLSAGRGATRPASSRGIGYWKTDVTNTTGRAVGDRPMSPTVAAAARPATARVNVRGHGRMDSHAFGSRLTHDAVAHGGVVEGGAVEIENVPMADEAARMDAGVARPTAKILRPTTEYNEQRKREAHDVNAAVFEFGGRTGASVTGTIRRQKSWEKVWQ